MKKRSYIAFSGMGGKHKKLTPDIIAFITHDFGHIYKRNKYSYNRVIYQDIKEVFGKELFLELIRLLLGKLKKAFQKNEGLSESKKKNLQKSPQVSSPEILPDQSPCTLL